MFKNLAAALIAYGPAGVFLLTILDSVGVPMPAALDALIVAVAWKTPGRAYLTAGLAVAGSLIGNIALFLAARGGGRRWVRTVNEPGASSRFRDWFARYGLITVFVPATLPIPLPLKIFVISAGVFHTPVSRFVVTIVIARAIRYFGEAYIGVQLGADAERFLKDNAFTFIGAALVLSLALYISIRLKDRRRNGTIL